MVMLCLRHFITHFRIVHSLFQRLAGESKFNAAANAQNKAGDILRQYGLA
jgi:hypothetical protein